MVEPEPERWVEDAASVAEASSAEAAPGCPRPSAAQFAQAILCDFDGDGRSDWCSPESRLLVAHARPDGTCATDDEAVQLRARAYCPWTPAALVIPAFGTDQRSEQNDVDAIADRVVCARMRGASAATTLSRLRRELAEGALSIEHLDVPAGRRVAVALERGEVLRLERLARSGALLSLSSATERVTSAHIAAPGVGRQDGAEWDAPWSAVEQEAAPTPPLSVRLARSSAAVRAACAAIEQRARARIEPHYPALLRDEEPWRGQRMELLHRSLARCYPAAGGAWALEATRGAPEEEGSKVRFELALRWVGEDGSRAAVLLKRDFDSSECDTHEVEVFGATDYDGDGRGELVYRVRERWCGDGDGINDERLRVSSARGAAIVAFAPLSAPSGLYATRAEDVDHDGRLDLWNDDHYPRTSCDPAAVNGSRFPVFPVLIHSLPDGRFTADDAVTQRAFSDRCRSLRQDFGFELDDDRVCGAHALLDTAAFNERAVCARAAGWSALAVQRAVISSLASIPRRPLFQCNAVPVISELIATRPPFAQPLVGAFATGPRAQ